MINIVRDSAPLQQAIPNVRRTIRVVFRRLFAAGALALFQLTAHAATGGLSVVTPVGPATQYITANSATLVYGGANASIGAGQAASLARAYQLEIDGAIKVADSLPIRVGGQTIAVTAARVVAGSLLPAIAVGAAAAGGYAVGTAVYDYLTDNGVHYTESGGFTRIPRQESSDLGSGVWTHAFVRNNLGWATPEAACQDLAQRNNYVFTSISPVDQHVKFCNFDGESQIGVNDYGTCPFGAGAGSTCAYGGAPVPATQGEVITHLSAGTPPARPAVVVQEAVGVGVKPQAGPVTLTGPATSPEPKVVTTVGPSGSTTSTTTNNYQYDGDTVTYNQTTVTNITNNAGDVTSTTTSTDTKPSDERTDCEKNPDTVGCAELDTPEGDIPKSEKNVSFQEEDVLGGGSCPANRSMSFSSIGGKTATVVEWSTFCDYALPVRALVIALASLTGFFIILPGGGNQP